MTTLESGHTMLLSNPPDLPIFSIQSQSTRWRVRNGMVWDARGVPGRSAWVLFRVCSGSKRGWFLDRIRKYLRVLRYSIDVYISSVMLTQLVYITPVVHQKGSFLEMKRTMSRWDSFCGTMMMWSVPKRRTIPYKARSISLSFGILWSAWSKITN